MRSKRTGSGFSGKLLSFGGNENKEKEEPSEVAHIEMKSISGVVLFEADMVACGYAEGDDTMYIVDAVDANGNIERHLFLLGQTFVHMSKKK